MQHSTFGTIIKTCREDKGLTLREVADLLSIDTSTLCKIENTERFPNEKMIATLAAFFGLDEKQLHISYLSDKLIYRLKNNEWSLEVLKAAEEKIEYKKRYNS